MKRGWLDGGASFSSNILHRYCTVFWLFGSRVSLSKPNGSERRGSSHFSLADGFVSRPGGAGGQGQWSL